MEPIYQHTSATICNKEEPLIFSYSLFPTDASISRLNANMEFQNLEFTLEDMLELHREWISKLYVEDLRSETEIVELLRERRLVVRASQIRECIKNWNLVQINTPEGSRTNSPTAWDRSPSRPRSEISQTCSYTPSDPDLMIIYTKRPLPSLPLHKTKRKTLLPFGCSSLERKYFKPRSDSLTLSQFYKGSWPPQLHDIETSLQLLPPSLSPIEIYIREEQAYERFAIGIERQETTAESRAESFIPNRRYCETRDDHTSPSRARITPREARKLARRRKRSEDNGKGKRG
jgi:hypothetical protein